MLLTQSTILLALVLTLMTIAVAIDIKEKKFPNILFLIILGLGCFYYITVKGIETIMVPLSLFFIFNLVGVFMHKLKLVAPGDMKFFSLFPFFLDWTGEASIIFIILLLIISMIYVSIRVFRKEKSIKAIFQNFKSQLFELKVFMLSRVRISPDYSQINKEEGIAFTIPLFFSFLIVFFGQQIGCI